MVLKEGNNENSTDHFSIELREAKLVEMLKSV